MDDDELRARLGAAGRTRVLGRFTWQVTAAGTADGYRALLEDVEAGRC
jgi:glycosyltransferase involved in cell wall biosynthesis